MKKFSRLTLILVYASFFMVQSFYTPLNDYQVFNASNHHINTLSQGKTRVKAFEKDKAPQKQVSFRLNKRFHPEAILSLLTFAVSPVAIRLTTLKKSKPLDFLLISSILTDSLRGPPAILSFNS